MRRFGPESWDDFLALHCDAKGAGWCRCVAWWTPTWREFAGRSMEENLAQRCELSARGEYDGYLLYLNERVIGWCQAGPRDRLAKLVAQFGLLPDPGAHALSCFFISPEERGRGRARHLLEAVVEDLARRGARRIEAFPKRVRSATASDLWTGPESLFRNAGFELWREDPERPVLVLEVGSGSCAATP